MDWSVEWDERAFKELESLDKQAQRNILKYLKKKIQTEEDPRRFGAPLHDDLAGLWKYRIGDYRLICTIEDNKLIILVLKPRFCSWMFENPAVVILKPIFMG